MSDPLVPGPSRPAAPQPTGVGDTADVWAWVGVGLCTAAALLAGLVESMLVPLYAGSVLVPLAPVLAIVLNLVLVITGRRAVDRLLGGLLPFLGWLVPVLAFSGYQPPELDVIYPGPLKAPVPAGEWLPYVGYGVVLGGGLAGAVALVLSTPLPAPRRPEAQESGASRYR